MLQITNQEEEINLKFTAAFIGVSERKIFFGIYTPLMLNTFKIKPIWRREIGQEPSRDAGDDTAVDRNLCVSLSGYHWGHAGVGKEGWVAQ